MCRLIVNEYEQLNEIPPTFFTLVDDFKIQSRDCGQLGIHLDFVSAERERLAGFPWWDHADADLRTMGLHEIPMGTTQTPFDDLEQGWRILIWENGGFVFIAESDDETGAEFHRWFRVEKHKYLAAWREVIDAARGKSKSYKSIKEALNNSDNVEALLLGNQGLRSLPDEIGDFPNLTYLELYHNFLCELPDSIGRLKRLRWIDLRFNQIRKLPVTFCLLENLESINLAENKLREIPECVCNMPKLRTFFVPGNPITRKVLKKFRKTRPDIEFDVLD